MTLALVLGAAAAAAPAGAAAPRIWAVPGLYGIEQSTCSEGIAEAQAASFIDPAFCRLLDEPLRKHIGRQFAAAMQASFAATDLDFAAGLPDGMTPRARLNAKLIASLRLTRAAIWKVPKGTAGVQGSLPLSLTLDITNAASGEVVFSRSKTFEGTGVYAHEDATQRLAAELPKHLQTAMLALVAEAAREWKPYAQSATVVGKAEGQWIVNQGRAHGLRTGDTIGDGAVITFAAADYSVVKLVLGDLREGQVLDRIATAPAAMLARPSVLSVIMDAPPGQSPAQLSQIFSDAAGKSSGLAPVPVNPSFVALRQLALGEAKAPEANSRSLPDYVAAVSVVALDPVDFPSNIPGVTFERHLAYAFVSLSDRSGRVVFTARGKGFIEDRVSMGVRFSPEQRRDAVVRNALIEAAGQLARFKPQPHELAIAAAGERLLIKDPGGLVPLGAELTVVRAAGRVSGIRSPIRVPVGTITASQLAAGGVEATSVDLTNVKLRSGDLALTEQFARPLSARAPVLRCAAGESAAIDDRGSVPSSVFSTAADWGFAASFNGAVYLSGLPARLQGLRADFADWDKLQATRSPAARTCFTPVLAVSAAKGAKAQRDLTVGFTVFAGPRKLGGSGMSATLTPTTVPAGTSESSAAALLQQDLSPTLLDLASQAGATVNPLILGY